MIGSSGFDGAAVPVEGALAQGQAVKADTVLVYSKYATTKTSSSKMQLVKEAAKKGSEIDPKDLVDEPTQHQYYASYWAKLPMPLLGVHIIKLKQKSRDDDDDVRASKEEPGLRIIAVIKASPADTAQIVKGDVLLKIGDVELAKPDDLFAAVQRYAGQVVEVKVVRKDATMNITVALNGKK
jgi:membrane-associated protease RseP (regulator of RpoE activity)